MKNLKKGFTLIELLVVVAIIGILASVVLASLTSARSKGKDAAVQAQLSNMRAQAELYYATNGNYGPGLAALAVTGGVSIMPATSCTANHATNVGTSIFGITAANSGLQGLVFGACNSGAQAIVAELNTNANAAGTPAVAWAVKATGASSNTFYCVDSSGTSKSYAADPTMTATATTAVCP